MGFFLIPFFAPETDEKIFQEIKTSFFLNLFDYVLINQ
jgi:hypothetical protein